MTEVGEGSQIDDQIESRREWLKDRQPAYLKAQGELREGLETAEIVVAFGEARRLIVDAPEPKSGEEALYRLGRLRAIFDRATKRANFIADYDAQMETYKLLRRAKADTKNNLGGPFQGIFDSL